LVKVILGEEKIGEPAIFWTMDEQVRKDKIYQEKAFKELYNNLLTEDEGIWGPFSETFVFDPEGDLATNFETNKVCWYSVNSKNQKHGNYFELSPDESLTLCKFQNDKPSGRNVILHKDGSI
jgi:hypothetical protein